MPPNEYEGLSLANLTEALRSAVAPQNDRLEKVERTLHSTSATLERMARIIEGEPGGRFSLPVRLDRIEQDTERIDPIDARLQIVERHVDRSRTALSTGNKIVIGIGWAITTAIALAGLLRH